MGATEVAEATRLVDICLEAGLTMFDTADVYSDGAAEEMLGRRSREARRGADLDQGRTFRSGPGRTTSARRAIICIQAVEGSLRRLGTDYIDLFSAAWL